MDLDNYAIDKLGILCCMVCQNRISVASTLAGLLADADKHERGYHGYEVTP